MRKAACLLSVVGESSFEHENDWFLVGNLAPFSHSITSLEPYDWGEKHSDGQGSQISSGWLRLIEELGGDSVTTFAITHPHNPHQIRFLFAMVDAGGKANAVNVKARLKLLESRIGYAADVVLAHVINMALTKTKLKASAPKWHEPIELFWTVSPKR